MSTFVLGSETGNMSARDFLAQMEGGDITVIDGNGSPVAYLMSPAARTEIIYAEAQRDLDLHRDEFNAAKISRDGVTTKEMLARAAEAVSRSSN